MATPKWLKQNYSQVSVGYKKGNGDVYHLSKRPVCLSLGSGAEYQALLTRRGKRS